MFLQTVHLDLTELTADQQVARLKEQHVFLRCKRALVRARVNELPVRQYISLLGARLPHQVGAPMDSSQRR